jgi:predicted nucleic acid-binding protein
LELNTRTSRREPLTLRQQRRPSRHGRPLGSTMRRIEVEDVTRAHQLIAAAPALSARDAIHLAVVQRRGISRILDFDAGFKGILAVERIGA